MLPKKGDFSRRLCKVPVTGFQKINFDFLEQSFGQNKIKKANMFKRQEAINDVTPSGEGLKNCEMHSLVEDKISKYV